MFDRFTDRAKKVLSFARQEAMKLNHDYIGTEHILLGLVQEGSGVAASVLKNMTVDLEQIRNEVEKIVKMGPSMVTMSQLPFTPRAKKVLELSLEEASQLGHNYIGTEHLLLGLIREKAGIATQVLRKLGLELDAVRKEMLEFLGSPDASAEVRQRFDSPPPDRRTATGTGTLFDRFTDRAKKVMDLAWRAAMELNHESIGTEHVLLGLVQEGTSVAANVLKNWIDLEKIRHKLEKIVKTGPSTVTMGQLPFTPSAKKVLELSLEEASQLRHNYIGTEHLLLGLIGEKQSIAAQVLLKLGVELDAVREEVLELLGSPDASDEVRQRFPSSPPDRRTATETGTLFDRFTDRAMKVLSFARLEAMKFNHKYIGTEHILLGLVLEGSGVAANVLKNMTVDLEKIRHEVQKIDATGPSTVTMGQLPFTPRAKKVLELSGEEARLLSHSYVGTEHLLLGLIRENQSVAAQVLRKLGFDLDAVREEVLEFLGSPDASDEVRRRFPSSPPDSRMAKEVGTQFDRFTYRAKRVMDLARRAALKLNHESIGTEHILLGLVQEGPSAAANVLKNMTIPLEKIRHEIAKVVKTGPSTVTMGQLPLTASAKRVLELSLEEASRLNQDYIGTEHVLLGLIRENEGIAAQVLRKLGVELDAVREEVLERMRRGPE